MADLVKCSAAGDADAFSGADRAKFTFHVQNSPQYSEQ